MNEKKVNEKITPPFNSGKIYNYFFNGDSKYYLNEMIVARIKEIFLLLLFFASVFLIIALLTYKSSDPSWSVAGFKGVVYNSAGRLGAWLSDFLLSFFGVSAWLVPILMMNKVVVMVKSRYNIWPQNGVIFIVRFLGISLLMLSIAMLSELFFPKFYNFPYSAGGIFGHLILQFFLDWFNAIGTFVVVLLMLLIGITLYTGISWLYFIDLANQGLFKVGHFFVLTGTKSYRWLSNLIRHHVRKITQLKKKQSLKEKKQSIQMPISSAVHLPSSPEKESCNDYIKQSSKHNMTLVINGLPEVALLDKAVLHHDAIDKDALKEIANLLELKLKDFGVDVKVMDAFPGPVITRYEIQPAPGTKASKVSNLAKDLARSLAVVSVRVVEVIPGKSVIGIEIPNDNREIVYLSQVIESKTFELFQSPLALSLGYSISGQSVVVDLAKMPHLLVAGTTGSGKSVGVNAMILSILFKANPEDVRLIMIDPKMLELSIYDGIPHLLAPVVTDMKQAANSLRWCVAEMERRYQLMAILGVRNIGGFNQKVESAKKTDNPLRDPLYEPLSLGGDPAPLLDKLPFIVVVIDEFADMMMIVGKKVEELIARIAQKARAAGIHLILATQRPSVDVITGLIKANIPTRISFQVSSKIDSRTIIDQGGAEQLLGHGDMLYLPPGTSVPIRVHGAFVSDDEVHRVVADWKKRGQPDYLDDILNTVDSSSGVKANQLDDDNETDPIYDEVVSFVTEVRKVSISSVQRKFKIGYNRSANIIESLEKAGVISSAATNGAREVLAPPPIKD